MADRHVMVTEATLPHGWMTQCPICTRRIFVQRSGGREIIDWGDFYALHSWSRNPELSIDAALREPNTAVKEIIDDDQELLDRLAET